MVAKPIGAQQTSKRAAAPNELETFLAALEHPFKTEILALRQIVLAADPNIAEGVKWKSLSFRTTEYFATFHFRASEGVQLILHRGAKRRATAGLSSVIADPAKLLQWLDEDRASVVFHNQDEIEARGAAFAQIIRQWIAHV